jgi:hypothetical protein
MRENPFESRLENPFPKIKSKDNLRSEMQEVIEEWHKLTFVDEQKLRWREARISEALSELNIDGDYSWKEENIELVKKFACAADTIPLVEKLKEMFDLGDISHGLAAWQVADEVKFKENREN